MADTLTEHERRLAWLTTVKRMHRWKRLTGILGCVLGACLMMWGRFSPGDAPDWAVAAGIGVVVFSWLMFIYVMMARWNWVKANPYTPG